MKQQDLRAAVLISGTGSNLKALITAVGEGGLALDIARVVSNRPEAPGIRHAEKAGVPTSVISHADYPDRRAHDAAVMTVLQSDKVELVVLAGYMRIIGAEFTRAYAGRMINLHPALLPLYRGLDTYNRVLQAGDAETGGSIHFVTEDLDAGPVISQVRIPVLPGDDAASLAARLGPEEHRLVVATVELFCQRTVHLQGGKVFHQGRELDKPLLLKHDGTFE
ncbi:MAG: phosphoribosylglycinamide formyltransferase [Lysobacterales bacterium]|jgi:phosphoribosylglycinamide formyltransferase-1